jgi:NADH-quinone oxidoreductase subunit J
LVGLVVLGELLLVLASWAFAPQATSGAAQTPPLASASNTQAIGEILYTDYIYFFQAAGMVLLVAMVGAIVLTLRHKAGVKRQSIAAQVARNPATAVEVRKVETGKGI